jgi:glycosyltransferase involved in cell wall biosynthesis
VPPVGPPVVEFILAKILRKKIIYDFDDAIWMDNTSDENSWARWVKFHNKVSSICRWSHRVSCGNAWLANYAHQFNGSVTVNPTTIDTENWHTLAQAPSKKNDYRIIIGWTGTHYLSSLVGVFQHLEKKYPIVLRIISNKDLKLPLANVEFLSWKKETEIQDLQTFDIGIMPLPDDAWAKGKCGFKALQYMSLGIPSVVSNVGVNVEIIEQGVNGYCCANLDEWQTNLERLILDKIVREEIGMKARAVVVDHFSVRSNGGNFLSLFR